MPLSSGLTHGAAIARLTGARTQRAFQWVTPTKAAELTGLPVTFFDERTNPSGLWPEGIVWKWFEGRKLIDLQALNSLIDLTPSVASNRGKRRVPANDAACLAQTQVA